MPSERGSPGAPALAAQRRRDMEAALVRMGARDRHARLMRSMELSRHAPPDHSSAGPAPAPIATRSDEDVLRESFRFIRSERDDAALGEWEARLARRYYARLYREFALADLSRYRAGALGLRWRTQGEVVRGKGQFTCGALGCDEGAALATFEVPFRYREAGHDRAALVKLRLCSTHARQLHYARGREGKREPEPERRDGSQRSGRRRSRSRSDRSPADGRPRSRSPQPSGADLEDDADFQKFLQGLAVG